MRTGADGAPNGVATACDLAFLERVHSVEPRAAEDADHCAPPPVRASCIALAPRGKQHARLLEQTRVCERRAREAGH